MTSLFHAAKAARTRRDLGGAHRSIERLMVIYAGYLAQPSTLSLAFIAPLRLALYTQISRRRFRPASTSVRSITSQLPLCR
eukprot:6197156-Pleurochrysis_carterae.AAC.6